MKLIKFNTLDQMSDIAQVLNLRQLPLSLLDDLPREGYLAYNDGALIATGFIRLCEGNYGFIDSYLTLPTAPQHLRHQALDLITEKLILRAKELGITKLLATSVDENTLLRGQRHGFEKLPHSVIALRIPQN